MLNQRRRGEAAQAVADRRRREDDAPRLRAEVPRLASLSLTIDERRPEAAIGGGTHIRRIVVEHAPALFVMPCTASGCSGVHHLTHAVLGALRQGATQFEGRTPCDACDCVLSHVATASYD